MRLRTLPDLYAIVRLDPDDAVPDWVYDSPLWSVTRSDSELSVVCAQDDIPEGASAERGWCALELVGPLDFSLTGVVASLVSPLADAEVPIFVLSTFETDYLLVREKDYARAVAALEAAGHDVDA
ncbi:MAG TPA: ACT domain-containing protein [Gaiellaceae bacterium]|nr:ACT domain-containing protein [Gaiellaceae bacterium]